MLTHIQYVILCIIHIDIIMFLTRLQNNQYFKEIENVRKNQLFIYGHYIWITPETQSRWGEEDIKRWVSEASSGGFDWSWFHRRRRSKRVSTIHLRSSCLGRIPQEPYSSHFLSQRLVHPRRHFSHRLRPRQAQQDMTLCV